MFEHYVGFHSNVFGYVKNKTIPLKVSLAACAPHCIWAAADSRPAYRRCMAELQTVLM